MGVRGKTRELEPAMGLPSRATRVERRRAEHRRQCDVGNAPTVRERPRDLVRARDAGARDAVGVPLRDLLPREADVPPSAR